VTWKITNVRRVNKNTLKAVCDLIAGEFTIKGLTYHEKGNSHWVGFPGREYLKPDGTKAFANIIYMENRERYDAFQKWAVAEVAAMIPAPEPMPRYVPQEQGPPAEHVISPNDNPDIHW